MDDLLNLILLEHGQDERKKRREGRDADRREALLAACETVAAWGPGSVVEPGWRPATEEDAAVQLAWAVIDLAEAVGRCGLAGRLDEMAAEAGDPARSFALALVVLAGGEGVREELERRVAAVWSRPWVWREVRGWFRRLPDLLRPIEPAVVQAEEGRTRSGGRQGGRKKVGNGRTVGAARIGGAGGDAGLPEEVTTAQAAEILGVSKDTVLAYRAKGVLPYRDIAPPGSTKPGYLFPRDEVLRMRTTYQTDQPAPEVPREPSRRSVKGRKKFKHLVLDEES